MHINECFEQFSHLHMSGVEYAILMGLMQAPLASTFLACGSKVLDSKLLFVFFALQAKKRTTKEDKVPTRRHNKWGRL
jgi:hypothetical protein